MNKKELKSLMIKKRETKNDKYKKTTNEINNTIIKGQKNSNLIEKNIDFETFEYKSKKFKKF